MSCTAIVADDSFMSGHRAGERADHLREGQHAGRLQGAWPEEGEPFPVADGGKEDCRKVFGRRWATSQGKFTVTIDK